MPTNVDQGDLESDLSLLTLTSAEITTEELSPTLLDIPDDVLATLATLLGRLHFRSLGELAKTCRLLYDACQRYCVWSALTRENQLRFDTAVSAVSISNAFLSAPRLRFDGFYACRQTYYRPGMPEIGAFHPMHIVTYYRYVRFFAPGTYGRLAMVLVTSREPGAVLNVLRHPSPIKSTAFKHANAYIGTWQRTNTHCINLKLKDKRGRAYDLQLLMRSGGRSLRAQRYIDVCDKYEYAVDDWGALVYSRVRSYTIP